MKLERLRALEKARTQGKWASCYDGSSVWSLGTEDPQANRIAAVQPYNGDWNAGSFNAAFIAALANAAPALLDIVEAAEIVCSTMTDKFPSIKMLKLAIAALETSEDK